jgi:UDP-N-acetylmuramoyl-tripeptide--D-alanyl-D-alanine ligase
MHSKNTWTAQALSEALGLESKISGNAIRFNSTEITSGDIFITLPDFNGENRALQYIDQAFARGAAGCITVLCEETRHYSESKMIYVKDLHQSLESLALYKRRKSNATFVAITGTCGKTTVKNMIYQLVVPSKEAFLGYQSFNNHLGVRLCLASIPDDVECAILELAMSAANEILNLTSIVRHDVALITNIGPGHLGSFESVDEIAAAKSEIFENMNEKGIAILPGDSPYLEYLLQRAAKKNLKIYRYGFLNGCDAQILDYFSDQSGTSLKVKVLDENFNVRIPLHGRHQALNCLASLLCSKLLGADMAKSVIAAENISLPEKRGNKFQLKIGEMRIVLIDKSYNANPLSVRGTLAELHHIQNRKVLILGDMLALGPRSLDLHKELKQSILDAKIDKIITIGEFSKHLQDVMPVEMQTFHAPCIDSAIPQILHYIQDQDTIVVQGSRAMRTDKVVSYLLKQSLFRADSIKA